MSVRKTKTSPIINTLQKKYYTKIEEAAKNHTPMQLMRKQWIQMIKQRIVNAWKVIDTEGFEKLPAAVKETIARYDLTKQNDHVDLLILKGNESQPAKVIVALEDSYEIVLQAHEVTDHGGISDMNEYLSQSNYLVSEVCLRNMIDVCIQCNGNEKQNNISVTDQPSKSDDNFSIDGLVLIDVIDMLKQLDNDFRYLLIYQDYNTKFVQLRPLTYDIYMTDEIVVELIRLFADIGPPKTIKVSKNLENFFDRVLHKIMFFTGIEIRLHKSEDINDRVEVLGQNIEVVLTDWMKSRVSSSWSFGCYLIQWKINNSIAEDGSTPFMKTYGREPFVSEVYETSESIVSLKISEDDTLYLNSESEDFKSNNDEETIEVTESEFKIEFDDNIEIDEASGLALFNNYVDSTEIIIPDKVINEN